MLSAEELGDENADRVTLLHQNS